MDNSSWKKTNLKLSKLSRLDVSNCQHKHQSGQTSLEFALVVPILILAVLAVSQFGYIIYLENVMQQAAREGVRIISTTNSNEKAYHEISKICSNLSQSELSINIFPQSSSSRNVGDFITVELSYRYKGFSDLIKKLTGKDVFIKVKSSMRMECY